MNFLKKEGSYRWYFHSARNANPWFKLFWPFRWI